jgi:hypothetical protein
VIVHDLHIPRRSLAPPETGTLVKIDAGTHNYRLVVVAACFLLEFGTCRRPTEADGG